MICVLKGCCQNGPITRRENRLITKVSGTCARFLRIAKVLLFFYEEEQLCFLLAEDRIYKQVYTRERVQALVRRWIEQMPFSESTTRCRLLSSFKIDGFGFICA